MTPFIVARSIIAQLKTDTGTGGLYEGNAWKFITGGMWHGAATPAGSEPFPYAVFTVDLAQTIGMRDDGQNVTINIDLYDKADNAFGNIEAAMLRIYGDAISQANRTPTYGLHRLASLTPTTPNTFSSTLNGFICTAQSASFADEKVVTGRMTFTARLQTNAA